MNKIVIPVSYMGSGSSVITDLLSEFDGYVAPMGSNELMLMHYPNGIFDLEDKLLVANNALRSDEAIRSFEKAMLELYDTKFWWVGNYREKVTPNFYQYVEEYVAALTQYEIDAFWYMQEKPTFPMLVKRIIGRAVKLLSFHNIILKRPLRYKTMKLSFIEEEEFYRITVDFLYKIFKDMGLDRHNLILDQLFTPFDIHRRPRYFKENIECFIVDRDPRDVFLLNKYVWRPADDPVPFPVDVREFIQYYKSIRRMERAGDCENVHRIHFEDLIYHYENTLQGIKDILKITDEQHKEQKSVFDPDKSINNTQLFCGYNYHDEVKMIEQDLGEYLYPFPYERKPDVEKSF